jgi:RNA polymerase sigma factor (sigma-70 family)
MTSNNDFQVLLSQAMAGHPQAISTLIERYEPQIRIVVRARLGASMKPYLDSMDIVQSVHRDMIAGLQRGQFEIESQEKLIALAATIVRRKIARHWRHLKREAMFPEHELADSHPVADPHDVLSAQELSDEIMNRLSDEDRQVLELRMLGHSTAEAARQLGLNPNVVRIRLSRLRKKLSVNSALYQSSLDQRTDGSA